MEKGTPSHNSRRKKRFHVISRSIAIFASLVGFCYSLYYTIDEYLHDNVVVKISHESPRIHVFPAVTICNRNPMLCSKLKNTSASQRLFGSSHCPLFGESTGEDEIWIKMSDRTRRRQFLTKAATLLTYVERMNLGQDWQSMIRECYFRDTKCTQRDFFHILSLEFGNCFTFGSIWNGSRVFEDDIKTSSIKKQYDTGPSQGLTLIFRANILDYIPGISDESGMKIFIHDPASLPEIKSSGIDVAPGKSTIIRVNKRVMSRLKYNCVKDWTDFTKLSFYMCKRKERYTQEGCLRYRKQMLFASECNCRSVELTGFGHYPYLDECEAYKLKNPKTAECMRHVEMSHDDDDDVCKPACKENQYMYSASSTDWPTPAFAKRIIRKYLTYSDMETPTGIITNDSAVDSFTSDFGKVLIYVDAATVQNMTEVEKFTAITLISNIGGLAGLYIGISFLSIYEIIEAVYLQGNGNETVDAKKDNDADQKQKTKSMERGAFQVQNSDSIVQSNFYVPFSSGSILTRSNRPNY